ncbi:DEAD/DEAH box helicase [Candidatus Gracilibacteria bacterium]|nr:DEAD/DEAH box helicase [Candidatus Gracilibacteria bacterium]
MLFSDLPIIEPILRAIADEGYTSPTPIQEQAIPSILGGRDFQGLAQTGTGKTAAFAIPIIQLLVAKKDPNKGKRKIKSLMVTPTRELAIQIEESFQSYGRYAGLHQTVVFGGVGQGKQVERLRQGVDILIATPGRLLDLMGQGYISLSDVEIFVLDEADRMLDMGFVNDVKKLLKVIPVKRQTLFFSATMAPAIATLAHSMLKNPLKVEITPVSTTAETITQHVYHVDKINKNPLIIHLLKDPSIKNVLVFTETKHGADKVTKFLVEKGISAEAIHGNKSQNNRQRALANFKEQTTRVLVATDIASRGIDIDALEYMINYDIPNISETYVHRIGRTGRAGARGVAYSFCEHDDMAFLRDIEKLISQSIPVIEDHPFPKTNFTLSPPKQQGRGGQGRPQQPKRETQSSPRGSSPQRRDHSAPQKSTPNRAPSSRDSSARPGSAQRPPRVSFGGTAPRPSSPRRESGR